jgi:hypothetical protein
MNLTWATGCECGRKRVSQTALVERYRVSRVAKGAPVLDVKRNRRAIVRDMVRLRRQLLIDGQRSLTAVLLPFFEATIKRVCDLALETGLNAGVPKPRDIDFLKPPKSAKAVFEIDLGGSPTEAAWAEAIRTALGPEADVALMTDYKPTVQSVSARAASRTAIFLGASASAQASVNILRRSTVLAQQVTRINETTRHQLVAAVRRTMDEGMTIAESVRSVRETVPQIARARIPTIARTEIGRAVDEGVKEMMKASGSVSHVSVIGCTAREPSSPQWRGESTCNIQNVPIEFVDELEFHPNHTGAIVATGFRD